MRPSHLVRLYPPQWRAEFGDEFVAMLEPMRLGPRDVVDILFCAAKERVRAFQPRIFGLCAWTLIAFFNVVAKEVQWCAGALLLCSAMSTACRPRRWLRSVLFLTSAVVISSLYFYQLPGRHEPLFHTIVALIPASIGALMGGMIALARSPRPA